MKGCVNCGRPLKRKATKVSVDDGVVVRDWREVAKLLDIPLEHIINVRHFRGLTRIRWVWVWDGQSYVDPYFCTDFCKNIFAYDMAKTVRQVLTEGQAEVG